MVEYTLKTLQKIWYSIIKFWTVKKYDILGNLHPHLTNYKYNKMILSGDEITSTKWIQYPQTKCNAGCGLCVVDTQKSSFLTVYFARLYKYPMQVTLNYSYYFYFKKGFKSFKVLDIIMS